MSHASHYQQDWMFVLGKMESCKRYLDLEVWSVELVREGRRMAWRRQSRLPGNFRVHVIEPPQRPRPSRRGPGDVQPRRSADFVTKSPTNMMVRLQEDVPDPDEPRLFAPKGQTRTLWFDPGTSSPGWDSRAGFGFWSPVNDKRPAAGMFYCDLYDVVLAEMLPSLRTPLPPPIFAIVVMYVL